MRAVYWSFSHLQWALALKTRGPERPKWVKSISPSSWKTTFFFWFFTVRVTFFRESPCIRAQVSPASSRGTREALGATMVCPTDSASRYPSPVDPVAG